MSTYKIKLEKTFDWERLGNSMSTFIKFGGEVLTVEWKDTVKEYAAKLGDYFMIKCDGDFPNVIKMKVPTDPVMRVMWENGATKSKRLDSLEELKEINIEYYHNGWDAYLSHTYLRITKDGNFAVMMYRPKTKYGYKPYAWWSKDVSKINIDTATAMTAWERRNETDVETHYYDIDKGLFYTKDIYRPKEDVFKELMEKVGMEDLNYHDAIAILKQDNIGLWQKGSVNLGNGYISAYVSDCFGNGHSIKVHYSSDIKRKAWGSGGIFERDYGITKEEVDKMIDVEENAEVLELKEVPLPEEFKGYPTDKHKRYLKAKLAVELPKIVGYKEVVEKAKERAKTLKELGLGVEWDDFHKKNVIKFNDKILDQYEVGYRYIKMSEGN